MTRKEEIQTEIAKLQAELESLNAKKYVLWSTGTIELESAALCLHLIDAQGNLFKTQESAERERDRRALIKELRDRAGGYKPVWGGETANFSLAWTWRGWSWSNWLNYDDCPRSGYFKEPIEGLIEEFGDRLNLLRDV